MLNNSAHETGEVQEDFFLPPFASFFLFFFQLLLCGIFITAVFILGFNLCHLPSCVDTTTGGRQSKGGERKHRAHPAPVSALQILNLTVLVGIQILCGASLLISMNAHVNTLKESMVLCVLRKALLLV